MVVVIILVLVALPATAQTRRQPAVGTVAATRLAIVAAEDRRAPTPRDLAVIRAGVHSADAQTVRVAVRALGRLERPELIADIVPSLKHALPEVRAEAANAIGQAAQGWMHQPASTAPRTNLDAAVAALTTRLNVEADPNVRAVIGDTIGRLPYTTAEQVGKAEQTLLDLMARSQTAADRLGVARGLEELVRLHRTLSPPDADLLAALRTLASMATLRSDVDLAAGTARQPPRQPARQPPRQRAASAPDPARDARVRRLALAALIDADSVDEAVIRRAVADPDVQVRRLAMRAASSSRIGSADVGAGVLKQGLADASPMVRLEALRALRTSGHALTGQVGAGLQTGPRVSPTTTTAGLDVCSASTAAVRDQDPHVAHVALDQLADCTSADAVAVLEHTVDDVSQAGSPRGWHRAAHAIVSLVRASPARGAAALPQFTGSRIWQLRMYAARAAAILNDRAALEMLARDANDNVKEAAIVGLTDVAGHGGDAVYIAALANGRYQVLRVAAAALAGTTAPNAVPALKAALNRLVVEGRDNSRDARTAIAETLRGLGTTADAATHRPAIATPELSAGELRQVASARARITIRGGGSFELALIGSEAPASAVRFVRLAQSGYYNGLTFHSVLPNFVIQGGSPGANEYIGDATFMRDELGQWPHVRGAVGISTRGRDTGDAQIFIDLVDNPRLDHQYTVFAHVLNGMDIVDAILEGDAIEKVEIVLGQ